MHWDKAFYAAYVVILARLWAELEHFCRLLRSAVPMDRARCETYEEILRLDLGLFQTSIGRRHGRLSPDQRQRLSAVIDEVLCVFDRVSGDRALALVAIERVQNRLFEQVRGLALGAVEPRRRTG